MKLICHNSISEIYDDDEKENWIWRSKTEGEPDYIWPKNENPIWPLAAVIKYGMTPDNNEILDELRKKAMENF